MRNGAFGQQTPGWRGTDHDDVTQLVPTYCEQLKWVDHVPDGWYVPHGEDNDGIDDDLWEGNVAYRSEVWWVDIGW